VDFLAYVVELLTDRGYRVGNVDATVMAERPKLKPHVPAIRERLASVLDVHLDQISVKAKTSEGLESVGRGEAIAAQAVALLQPR
jgi:2-C-methyl-D-erythritol 2,4-cyclodiphosphate synthase